MWLKGIKISSLRFGGKGQVDPILLLLLLLLERERSECLEEVHRCALRDNSNVVEKKVQYGVELKGQVVPTCVE